MGIFIEKISAKDSSAAVKLLEELYIELGEEKESIFFLTNILVEEIINSGITEIYFLHYEDKVIGIFTLTESQAIYAGGKYGVIDEMYVKPEYRNNNYGKNIIDFIIDIARHKGWKRIDVTAPTENKWERTNKFYESNGFFFTGPKFKFSKLNK